MKENESERAEESEEERESRAEGVQANKLK